jgi:hypothetical protein
VAEITGEMTLLNAEVSQRYTNFVDFSRLWSMNVSNVDFRLDEPSSLSVVWAEEGELT